MGASQLDRTDVVEKERAEDAMIDGARYWGRVD